MAVEKNYRNINKNIHYFALMQVPDHYFGIISCVSSDSPWYWIECYVDEERYKVEDNYKITLRACNGCTYEHYYQDDFLSLMYEGLIVPKTSEDIHMEIVSFKEFIPNSIAYLEHTGCLLVGTFDNKINIGDIVRIRSFSFTTKVININEDTGEYLVEWFDDDGNRHTLTCYFEELMKVV